jgi:hypothetical protein
VGGAVAWDAADFFVPPGLWGIGIGENFLDLLTSGGGKLFAAGGMLASADSLLVRFRVHDSASVGYAARKTSADLTQMYRAAGFSERAPDDPSVVDAAAGLSLKASEWRWFRAPLPRRAATDPRRAATAATGA